MAAGFNGEIPQDFFPVIVCEKMHWTYQQYLEQPRWFIDGLATIWSATAKITNKKING